MKVTLINHTSDAAVLLIFTKGTRLGLTPGRYEAIKNMSSDKKMEELKYIASTIPSSWEFVDYTFVIEGVSRAFTHQLVRTRTASYAQESLNVVDKRNLEYVFTEEDNKANTKHRIIEYIDYTKALYKELLSAGVSKGSARGILPIHTATNIVMKCNLRTLNQLVRTRLGRRNNSEFPKVLNAMVDEVLKVHPWTDLFLWGEATRDHYKDIETAIVRNVTDQKAQWDMLKMIDKMRREEK